jgi:hypothetical protein
MLLLVLACMFNDDMMVGDVEAETLTFFFSFKMLCLSTIDRRQEYTEGEMEESYGREEGAVALNSLSKGEYGRLYTAITSSDQVFIA